MDFSKLKTRLEKNGFAVSVFETAAEARDYLDREIDGVTVGKGGSLSIDEMGLIPLLEKHNTVYAWKGAGDRGEIMKKAAVADIYLMSANAISEESGEILNIDGTGNRVSSSVFGHKKVYMMAGRNKVSPDFDSAYKRLRNVVSPKNAQRLKRDTPCAKNADRCYDCDSPERICNVLCVHYKKPRAVDIEVVLIDEELGL